MAKIVQVSTAITLEPQGGNEIVRTVCVDDEGQAWELHGSVRVGNAKWTKLPTLPS